MFIFLERQKRDLLYELIRSSFKLRYNDSILGFIWVILKPLLNFLVLYIIFSNFKADLGTGVDTFQIYLLTGIIFYGYFSESLLTGMNSLLGMAHIILKVKFPKELAVMSSQGLALINFLITFTILIIVSLFNNISPNLLSIVYLLYQIFLLSVFCYSLTIWFSVLTIRFRDLRNIFEILLQLGFYLSPIFYSVDFIPESYRGIYMLNPITIIMQSARTALISGNIINLKSSAILLLVSILMIVVGSRFFKKQVQKVTEYY